MKKGKQYWVSIVISLVVLIGSTAACATTKPEEATPPTGTVKVNDISIYYEIHGEGEPLVLIMGWTFNSAHWFLQLPAFSEEYRVVVFDNRGTGRSDKPDGPYTMEMMAGDTAGLLDSIDIDAAHIYGISMGGMIAQEFALRYPHKVTSLILGSTTCGGPNSIPSAPHVDPEAAERTPEENIRANLERIWSQEFIDNNPDLVGQHIAATLEYPTPTCGRLGQQKAVWAHDTYDRLPQIRAPTLVIAGSVDELVPVENSKILASRIPDAELVILKDAPHHFFTHTLEEANEAILDFLGRHPCPR